MTCPPLKTSVTMLRQLSHSPVSSMKMPTLLLSILLLCTGCQHHAYSPYDECADLEYEGRQFCAVSFTELLGNPDELNNVDVAVQGFVTIWPSNGLAFLMPSLEERWFTLSEFAVFLNITSDIVSLNLAERENERITVQGKFLWDPTGMNPYRRRLAEISLISGDELKAR